MTTSFVLLKALLKDFVFFDGELNIWLVSLTIYKSSFAKLLNSTPMAGLRLPPSNFIDELQKKAIQLIGENYIMEKLDTLKHRRDVGTFAAFVNLQ